MAEITAALVKQLREMTDSPMMECKKALVEADGDMDKAVDVLRTRGIAKSLKLAAPPARAPSWLSSARTARLPPSPRWCETDFVSGTDKFKNMVAKVAEAAALSDAADVEALKAATVDGETVEAIIANGIATMGENMTLTRFARRVVENGAVASYIHGRQDRRSRRVRAWQRCHRSERRVQDAGSRRAMQVAATKPLCAVREDMNPEVDGHD